MCGNGDYFVLISFNDIFLSDDSHGTYSTNATYSGVAMDIDDVDLLTPMQCRNIDARIYCADPQHSAKCPVCKAKLSRKQLTSHYLKMHPTFEVYTSRLSPEFAMKAMNEPLPTKYEYDDKGRTMRTYCYFCATERGFTQAYWLTHILSHTGEYSYECTKCEMKILNAAAHKKSCAPFKSKTLHEFKFTDGYLWAFMCKQCHYVQVREKNMKSHLRNEHLHLERDIDCYYDRIKLISDQMCPPIVEVKQEIHGGMSERFDMVSSPVELSNEMPEQPTAVSSESLQEPISQVKNEPTDCIDEAVSVGYAQRNALEEVVSSSIIHRLIEDPDAVPVQLAFNEVKTERLDGNLCIRAEFCLPQFYSCSSTRQSDHCIIYPIYLISSLNIICKWI